MSYIWGLTVFTAIPWPFILPDLDLIPADTTSPLNLTINRNRESELNKNETVDVVSLVTVAPTIQTSIPTINQQTLLKPQTAIILTTQGAPLTTPTVTSDRFVLPKVKQEPSEGSLSPEYSRFFHHWSYVWIVNPQVNIYQNYIYILEWLNGVNGMCTYKLSCYTCMYLTHCALVTPYNWFDIGSVNGLLPDGNKPLPEPMLTYHH